MLTGDPAVYCQHCGALIGWYVQVEKQVWLQIGMIKTRVLHGQCTCGAQFHYCASDKMLEALIERTLRNRELQSASK